MMFDSFKTRGLTSIYYRIPIEFLDSFRSEMAKQGKYFKIRYRGPRANTPSARYRSPMTRQSTCIKQDATHFSAYSY